MFSEQVYVIMLFKAVTLLLLVVGGIVLYIQHLKPILAKMIDDQRYEFQRLQRTCVSLDEQRTNLDQRTHVQREEAFELMRKIQLWRMAVEREKKMHMHACAVIEKKLMSAYQEQQERAYVDKQCRELGLQVLAHVQADLATTFHNSERSADYIQAITTAMKDGAL